MYDYVSELVATIREASNNLDPIFWRPSDQAQFQFAIEVALHNAGPGNLVVLKNRTSPAYRYMVDDWVSDFYHGTLPSKLPSIIVQGFSFELWRRVI